MAPKVYFILINLFSLIEDFLYAILEHQLGVLVEAHPRKKVSIKPSSF